MRRLYGGPRAAARFLTLGDLGGVCAVDAGARGAFFLQTRCAAPLDRYEFGSAARVRACVREVLQSFARLHAAGYVHGDVKLDNMMACGARFKLIDFFKAAPVAGLAAAYAAHAWWPPTSSRSPMSWRAWGAEHYTGVVFAANLIAVYGRDLVTSPEFREFAQSAYASTERAVAAWRAAHPGAPPSDLAAVYARSFDLFDLGCGLQALACAGPPRMPAPRASAGVRADLRELARRLTHYDAPDFTQDAREALAAWAAAGAVRRG